MNLNKQSKVWLLGGLAIALAALSFTTTARANVYATNIKLNGSLSSISTASGSAVTITYILNEAATSGTTIKILSGVTVVDTISIASGSAGTLRGLNTVTWGGTNSVGVNVPAGTYSVSITAAAVGYGNWTQTSVDANAGNAAYYPWGIDVDKNTNSPYYGRVVMSSAGSGGSTDPNRDGLYKMNADGSVADEGWYGNAGYLADDGGDGATSGQMPNSYGFNPQTIRIGEDDRIYWCDNSGKGAIVACDIKATTNQVVIKEAGYSTCPDANLLAVGGWGVRQFDVCGVGTTNASVYLVDTGDYPSWGVWMWHLTNGVADPTDTTGTQAVATGGDLGFTTGAGIAVDYNLDIFVSQSRGNAGDANNRTFCFTNWNGGVLPPKANSFNYSEATGSFWQVGASDDYMTAIWDTVINSRSNPTLVAVAMAGGAPVAGGYSGDNGGIRILNATNGSTVITNLDLANWYNGAAFDNVGNVYGCSRSNNKWRTWSPPGANTNTTVAVATMNVTAPLIITITSITVSGTTVTVNFTGSASDPASAYKLLSSAAVVPASGYVQDGGAVISLVSPGVFKAVTTTSGSARFYRIKR